MSSASAGAPPRVLVLSPGLFDKGGIARYGRFQIQALRDAGARVHVMSLRGQRPGDFETPFTVDYAGDAALDHQSRVAFALAAARWALAQRPEIVWTGHLNLGPLGLTLARLVGARLVQNIYGREVWSAMRWPRRWALARADRVVSDCHNTAARAVDLGLLRRPAEVVWDCVDTQRFAPGERNWQLAAKYRVAPHEGTTLLFLARLHTHTRYKGSERVLDLLARLGPTARLLFAGSGDDLEHLRARAHTLGLAERVVFMGSIAEDDLPAVYRFADVFYLASAVGPWQGEGLPLTPIEAMACGVPVIVGDADGSREILLGGGGHCGPPTDLEAQAAYVRCLTADRDFLARERTRARARAVEAFAYDIFRGRTIAALATARA